MKLKTEYCSRVIRPNLARENKKRLFENHNQWKMYTCDIMPQPKICIELSLLKDAYNFATRFTPLGNLRPAQLPGYLLLLFNFCTFQRHHTKDRAGYWSTAYHHFCFDHSGGSASWAVPFSQSLCVQCTALPLNLSSPPGSLVTCKGLSLHSSYAH